MGSRVINGHTAQRHAWPWQISLRVNGGHICGGSIISPWGILTASHCVERNPYPKDTLLLSVINWPHQSPKGSFSFTFSSLYLSNSFDFLALNIPFFLNFKFTIISPKRQMSFLPQSYSVTPIHTFGRRFTTVHNLLFCVYTLCSMKVSIGN